MAQPQQEPLSPENQALEKELYDQIEQIKKRSDTKNDTNTGEMDFKDEPPFQDDLPF